MKRIFREKNYLKMVLKSINKNMKIKNFITYGVINTKRKCWYVGYSTRGLETRKRRHYYYCFQKKQDWKFYRFIRKYGWDSFEWEVIEHYNTEEEMIQGEIDNIKIYKEKYKNGVCLNMTKGGDGGDTFTNNPNKEKTREKIRMAKKDFYQTPEGKKVQKIISKKTSGPNHPRARAVVLISPEGEEFCVPYYSGFCLEHKLDSGTVCKVLKGKYEYHKGWKAVYL